MAGGFLLTRLIESVTSSFTTLAKEREVAEFFLTSGAVCDPYHPAMFGAYSHQQALAVS